MTDSWMLPLRTIALTYIARNLHLFWKEKWNPEILKITKESDDILLDLPSAIRLEIFLYSSKNGFLDVKALLLLLDHNSLSGTSLNRSTTRTLNDTINVKNALTLLARRCKRSTSLSLSDLSFIKDPSFGDVLGTFRNLTTLRLHSTHHDIVKVIGTSLRNLEELILGYIDFNYYGVIRFLVSGCRKLKILHVERGVTIKCAEYLLLGLPNLIEFKHPLMVVALEWIIRSGKADRVSAIRKLYIGAGDDDESQVSMYLESAHMVMRHLTNITMLEMNIRSAHCIKPLKSFSVKITNISQLTKLIIKDFSVTISDYVLPIVQAMGHYLTLLDLLCLDYSWLDVIDHCRELRVLRITAIYKDVSRFDIVQPEMGDQNYGSDPQENITPFHHLQELHLSNLINAHLKPALLKSLVASPLLQDLKLRRIHSFTDHVVKAAFNHINQDGEQLAFTSLRTLELDCCNFITNNLMKLVTHERVPLEELLVTLWVTDVETEIFERFKEKMNDANDDDDDYENERYLNRDIDSPFDYICFGD